LPRPRPEPDFDAVKAERELLLRDARRQLILDGAWKVFRRDGFDGSTMRAIAAAAGCTTGAIYPLFASKELIYAALLAQSLSRLNKSVSQAMTNTDTATDRLRAGATAFVSYYRTRPDEVVLGLYLWNGVRPRGLNRSLDRDLNRRLSDTLNLFSNTFVELGRSESASRALTAALFAFMTGAIVVSQTGRLRTLGSTLDDSVDLHMGMLLQYCDSNAKPKARRS